MGKGGRPGSRNDSRMTVPLLQTRQGKAILLFASTLLILTLIISTFLFVPSTSDDVSVSQLLDRPSTPTPAVPGHPVSSVKRGVAFYLRNMTPWHFLRLAIIFAVVGGLVAGVWCLFVYVLVPFAQYFGELDLSSPDIPPVPAPGPKPTPKPDWVVDPRTQWKWIDVKNTILSVGPLAISLVLMCLALYHQVPCCKNSISAASTCLGSTISGIRTYYSPDTTPKSENVLGAVKKPKAFKSVKSSAALEFRTALLADDSLKYECYIRHAQSGKMVDINDPGKILSRNASDFITTRLHSFRIKIDDHKQIYAIIMDKDMVLSKAILAFYRELMKKHNQPFILMNGRWFLACDTAEGAGADITMQPITKDNLAEAENHFRAFLEELRKPVGAKPGVGKPEDTVGAKPEVGKPEATVGAKSEVEPVDPLHLAAAEPEPVPSEAPLDPSSS